MLLKEEMNMRPGGCEAALLIPLPQLGTKLLGVTVDSKSSWKKQIKNIVKMGRGLSMMRRHDSFFLFFFKLYYNELCY